VRRAIATYDWKGVHPGLSLTASIGYSADTSVADYDRMLAAADANLYKAKERGRNCVAGEWSPR
jgi:GGDEF domain-containing protein